MHGVRVDELVTPKGAHDVREFTCTIIIHYEKLFL